MSRSFFERLRERAVEIHVEDHLRARLERGDRLRVKLGLDPTAPDLHVGHLVVLDTLKMFQDAGHTVVVIIGDYTALIGDPSGRSVPRPMLSEEEIAETQKGFATYGVRTAPSKPAPNPSAAAKSARRKEKTMGGST